MFREWGEGAWGACKIQRNEQGVRGSKIKSFERIYFLNDREVFSLQLKSMTC